MSFGFGYPYAYSGYGYPYYGYSYPYYGYGYPAYAYPGYAYPYAYGYPAAYGYPYLDPSAYGYPPGYYGYSHCVDPAAGAVAGRSRGAVIGRAVGASGYHPDAGAGAVVGGAIGAVVGGVAASSGCWSRALLRRSRPSFGGQSSWPRYEMPSPFRKTAVDERVRKTLRYAANLLGFAVSRQVEPERQRELLSAVSPVGPSIRSSE